MLIGFGSLLNNRGRTTVRRFLTLMASLVLVCGSALASENVLINDLPPQGQKPSTDIRPGDVIKWVADSAMVLPSGEVSVGIRLTTLQGFTLYADKIRFVGPLGFSITRITSPRSETIVDPITQREVQAIAGGDFSLAFVGPQGFNQPTFPIEVTYIACTKIICLFPHTEFLAPPAFLQTTASGVTANPTNQEPLALDTRLPAIDVAPPLTEDLESRWARELSTGGFSFAMILIAAFVGGLLTNLTPCVAPMIPITMRLLSGHNMKPIVGASLYAGGILVTYTGLGLFAALSGGMFGSLMANPTFNIIFASVMILLGLSMLGFGNFAKLQTIGSRLGSGSPSKFNLLLMGAGAGLVAAPCTGPILAALLAYTAKNQNVSQSTVLLMTYSLGFALPYVFLGGAAAKVKKIKVSFRIQVAVKLVFAAVMFALGIYYLRIPAYKVFTQFAGHWGQIATIAGLSGIALATTWIVLPALQNHKKSMTIPSMVLAVGIFAATQWATTKSPSALSGLKWHKIEAEAFAEAAKSGKPILVDAWAEWCEACKKMDVTTFAEPDVIDTLGKGWILIKLDLTESTDENDALQEKYGIRSLPTLTMIPSSGNLAKIEHIVGYANGATLLSRLKGYRTE